MTVKSVLMLAAGLAAGVIRADYSRATVDCSSLPAEKRFLAEIVTSRIAERTPVTDRADTLSVTFRLEGDATSENAVVTVAEGKATVTGGRFRALVYGAGTLLREIRYGRDTFAIADGVYRFEPKKPLRMGDIERHFDNWYHRAPAGKILKYIDDLALLGLNSFRYQYRVAECDLADTSEGDRIAFEEVSRKMAERIHALDCGLCEHGGSNQVTDDAPEHLRAVPNTDRERGNTGFNVCPSRKEGMDYLMDFHSKRLAELKDVQIEFFEHLPFDEGGCECGDCAPYGGKAFPNLVKKLRDIYKKDHPQAKVIVDTWLFHDDDWAEFYKYLEKNDWIDYVLADGHRDFPKYPLEHPIPKGIPLITFPEISMWGRDPWGGYGATPLPKRFERLFRQADPVSSGCMFYSEGIYEDLNKEVVVGLYVNPKGNAEELVRRYARYQLCGVAEDDLVRLCALLEANHLFPRRRNEPDFRGIGESDRELCEYRVRAEEASALAEKMNADILPSLKTCWRWRLLYLRTKIDREIFATRNAAPKSAKPHFDEIVALFHAEEEMTKWKRGRLGATCPHYAQDGDYSRVVIDASALPEEKRFVGRMLTERIEARIRPSSIAETLSVSFAIDPSVRGENAIVTVRDGRATVAAGQFRALVHGAGELLRAMRFGKDRLILGDGVYRFEPKKELRMGYLARHFDNWYHYATAEELCDYSDDLVLAGLNAFNFQYYYPEVNVAEASPAERRRFEDVSKKLLDHIHALGCGFCENGGSNQVPLDTPEKYRGVPNSDPHRGNAGFNACPSMEGGTEYILKVREDCLARIKDHNIEYFNHWPFDEGGCECEKCRPWGGNAFPVLSEKLHRLNKKAHPEAKTMVSTWVFHDDDFEGLWKYLETHDWVDYVLVDSHREFPKYPLEHPIPRHIPIVTFPEISMWGRDPWGGYGATALPKRFERLFHQAESVTGGCMYYSEGLYEDLNKEVVTRLYVNPAATAEDIVRSYARLHFCGTDPEDFVRLCEIYETNHLFPRRRNNPDFRGIGEGDAELKEYVVRAEEACRIVRKMDRDILSPLRNTWRFRLMYLRALIDREIFVTRQSAPETARSYFDELVRTYRAEIQLNKWRKTKKMGCTCPHYAQEGLTE